MRYFLVSRFEIRTPREIALPSYIVKATSSRLSRMGFMGSTSSPMVFHARCQSACVNVC